MQICPGKERQSANYTKNVERLQEQNQDTARKKEKLSKECHKDLG